MDKVEYYAVIKYFVLMLTKIKNEFDSNLSFTSFYQSSSFSTVKKWATEFKRDRTSNNDDRSSKNPFKKSIISLNDR